jgi:hypothetical protein
MTVRYGMRDMRWAWVCRLLGHGWHADGRVRVPDDPKPVRVATYRCVRCWAIWHVPYHGDDGPPARSELR